MNNISAIEQIRPGSGFSETAWMSQAICQGATNTFFPDPKDLNASNLKLHEERAKKICAQCPVIGACLSYALREKIEYGVWGGMSEKERRKVVRRRQISNYI